MSTNSGVIDPFLETVIQPVKSYLDDLIRDREESDHAAESSKDKLYNLLAKCLRLYELMTEGTKEADKLIADFDAHVAASALRFNGDTHMVAKIAGVVFNPKGQKPDRRRASSYGKVLQVARANKITSDGLVKFIKDRGGVERVRDDGSDDKGMSTEAKADNVWTSLNTVEGTPVELPLSVEEDDPTFRNKRVVLLATQRSGSKFVVHGVVKASAAVDAAFATRYNANTAVTGSTVTFNTARQSSELDKARAEIVNTAEG